MQPAPQKLSGSRCLSLAFLMMLCLLVLFLDITFVSSIRKLFRRPRGHPPASAWKPTSRRAPNAPRSAPRHAAAGSSRGTHGPPSPGPRHRSPVAVRAPPAAPHRKPPPPPARRSAPAAPHVSRPVHLPDHVPPPACNGSHGQPLPRRNNAGPRPADRGGHAPSPDRSGRHSFVFLKMWDLYYHRIGNLIWAYASLVGIARTNHYQPRVEARDYRRLQVSPPAVLWSAVSDGDLCDDGTGFDIIAFGLGGAMRLSPPFQRAPGPLRSGRSGGC